MSEQVKAGDRVEMTEAAYRQGLEGRNGKPCFGTVKRIARRGSLVVVRDGYKSEEYWHPTFWRRTGGP